MIGRGLRRCRYGLALVQASCDGAIIMLNGEVVERRPAGANRHDRVSGQIRFHWWPDRTAPI